jgi:hypothetical protein
MASRNRIPTSLLQVRESDGASVIRRALEAAPALVRDAGGDELDQARAAEMLVAARAGQVLGAVEFDARMYKQTLGQPLTEGYQSLQQHVLFWPGAMRALTRSFRGVPFVDGHDWKATRSAGGSVGDTTTAVDDGDPPPMRILGAVTADQPWSVAGVLSKSIRMFSIGFVPTGQIHCSLHNAEIFDKCYCWPGDLVAGDGDGAPTRVAQWLIKSAVGVELSPVNVPAVGNGATGIDAIRLGLEDLQRHLPNDVRALLGAHQAEPALDLAEVWTLAHGAGVAVGPLREALARRNALPYDGRATTTTRGNTMDPALVRKMLGLPATATDAEVDARALSLRQAEAERNMMAQLSAEAGAATATAAAAEAQRAAAARLEAGITRLRTAGAIPLQRDATTLQLVTHAREVEFRQYAADFGLDAFERHADQVLRIMPARPVESQSQRAADPGVAVPLEVQRARAAAPLPTTLADETLDAYAQHRANPELARMMRSARITPAHVAEHGPRTIGILSNLRELATAQPTAPGGSAELHGVRSAGALASGAR